MFAQTPSFQGGCVTLWYAELAFCILTLADAEQSRLTLPRGTEPFLLPLQDLGAQGAARS